MQTLNRTITSSIAPTQQKVLLFGGGNFIRAFAAWMIDLLNEKTDFNGGIIIVKPTKGRDYIPLKEQEGLYHLILNGIQDGKRLQTIHLIQSVTSVIHSYQQWEDFLASAENPDIRYIISNTTEAGITFDSKDQLEDNPPDSFPAKVTSWLFHRFQHFKGDPKMACVFLPCELTAANGDELRLFLLQYADQWKLGTAFKNWLTTYCIFCNTLVDRIVTGYPHDRKEELRQKIGFEDQLMVVGEPYHSWVIQGPEALAEELPLHKIGLQVKWVKNLDVYREQKVKILNGAHTAMVPLGHLSGKISVKEAVEDEAIGEFIKNLLQEEVWPTLDFPEAELADFTSKTMDRFKNPFIFHKLMDISLNSISKFKTRLLPTLLDYHAQNSTCPSRICFAFAALIVLYKGHWNGKNILLRDEDKVIDFFQSAWSTHGNDPSLLSRDILGNTAFWGQDLNGISGLSEMLSHYISQIEQKGMPAALSILKLSTKN